MKQTAVEWLENEIAGLDTGMSFHYFEDKIQQAKEMEKQQQCYSEEEILPLLEILQKCKEYFLLKTDKYSDERADAIIDVLENFKNK
jgi:hypothetical protein